MNSLNPACRSSAAPTGAHVQPAAPPRNSPPQSGRPGSGAPPVNPDGHHPAERKQTGEHEGDRQPVAGEEIRRRLVAGQHHLGSIVGHELHQQLLTLLIATGVQVSP